MRALDAFIRSAVYERRFLSKNPWDLAMVLWIPLVTVLMVWWIFSNTQITNLPIGVIDQDHSPMSNTVLRYLDASPDITIKQLYDSPLAAQNAILQRDIYAVVTIPSDFSRHILSNEPAPLILQVNAQYGTHSGIIQKSVQSVAGTLSAGVEIQRLVKQGMNPSQAAISYAPIGITRISLFNAETNYQQFLASTVIPALLHILAMVIGATTIGRELRDKNLGRWYRFIDTGTPDLVRPKDQPNPANTHGLHQAASPKIDSSPSLGILLSGLIGKYFWPMLAFSLWSALALWLATYQQNIDKDAIIATYFGLVILMALSFWLGAIFTLATFSLRIGLSATGFISAPSYAFAGVTFPYIAINEQAKHWSDILPLTHYLKLQIAQLQMQAPLALSLPTIYGLTLATVIAMGVAGLLTKRALNNPHRWGAR